MNRFQLNQILEILLFPLIDPELGKNDYLYACYKAYHSFTKTSVISVFGETERMRKNNEYKKVRKNLIYYLIERNHWRVKDEDEIEMLCKLYYPMPGIDRFIEYIRAKKYAKGIRGCANIDLDNISSYYLLEMVPKISNL